MKQILQHTLVLCGSLLALAGCSTEELATEPTSGKPATLVATIGSNTDTRTGHTEGDGDKVKVSWNLGDGINLYSGNLSASNAPVTFVCESIDATTGVGTFGSEQTPAPGETYFALYPATLTHDLKLSMLGQTQASNGDMTHLGAYDAMRTETTDWTKVAFTASSPGGTSVHLASLITFDLQNLPLALGVPQKITLGCIDGSGDAAKVFQKTLNGDANSKTSSLSLALGTGFTAIADESNRLKAYLMVAPATIPTGHKLTITVEGSLANYQFTSNAVGASAINYEAGKRHLAEVKGEGSWTKFIARTTYTGGEPAEALTGDGSKADPYLIRSAGQLRTLIEGTKVSANNGYKGKYFKLMTDINITMAGDGVWTPIGNGVDTSIFRGHFDGNGHTISGTMTGTTDNLGFFGYTSGATITNLTVDATVSGGMNVGGIVGQASTSTLISNCINKGAVTGTSNRIGGIVGYGAGVTISNCTNQGSITVTAGQGSGGGIAGTIEGSSIILGCVNEGVVLGEVWHSFGGIAGNVTGSSIIACYNTAAVTTPAYYGGGIAGTLASSSITTACYNTGKIAQGNSGANNIGTIAGKNLAGCTVSYCQWVLHTGNTNLPAFPPIIDASTGTGTKNIKHDDLAALNVAGVAALNAGIAAWNKTNAAGSAKHCPFSFVASTAGTGPTLEAGAPPAPPSSSGGVGDIGDGAAALPK